MDDKKLRRAMSVKALLRKKFKTMRFLGPWKESFGEELEMSGVWLVWGNSGNGKTRFCMQLAKYLTHFGKVVYDTMEEGARMTFQKVLRESHMEQVKRLTVLNREPIDELRERLRKRNSPDIVIVDSFQHMGLSKPKYLKLKGEFPDKLFVFVSHAEGKQPEGRSAKFVRYDADVKIRVEGYRALPTSRYGGGRPYVIWEEGAADYWGEAE
ncbi:hypothetical protein FUAX_41080 (plasmid) [Fulvitalea axinellae]|uniref:ORC1/DEAH AAA+ ATPase domain-containing protein n=1 Tax=Fulvitalea axinellae TaxID=1182444 RepID=A0AAU9CHP0_9BACT|nr:hypothetical protein FUAX_41080 [Fulvitalea axinellae]